MISPLTMEENTNMCNKYEGKTVDEALFRGLNELEISIDEVDVEIIQRESKGVLGIGKRPAIVMLKKREMPREFMADPTPARSPRAERSDRYDRPRKNTRRYENNPETEHMQPDREPEQFTNEGYEPESYSSRPEQSSNRQRRSGYSNDRSSRYSNNHTEYNYTDEDAENSAAAQFVSALLTHMGIDAHVTAANAEGEQRVNIASEESAALLIGKRGETLDAIQYLAALVVNREGEEDRHIKVSVDVDGYRQRRYEKLVRTARAKAGMVKSTGRDYSFEPMTAFDRRIIHYALQRNPYVTTHSEGEEPNRYVIISAKRRPRRY